MSLSLPIYKRGSKYVLHLRIADQQIKRTLDTSDPAVARVRGIQLMNQLPGFTSASQARSYERIPISSHSKELTSFLYMLVPVFNIYVAFNNSAMRSGDRGRLKK
jgi:hypothetical protein